MRRLYRFVLIAGFMSPLAAAIAAGCSDDTGGNTTASTGTAATGTASTGTAGTGGEGTGGMGGGAGGIGGMGGAGGAGGGSAGDCSAAGTAYVKNPDLGLDAAGTGVTRLPADASLPAFGITWLKEGFRYFLVRQGDASDGSFDKAQAYDASAYPYHMLLVVRPDGWDDAKCMGDPAQCQEYYGLSGTWTITSTTPFQGTIAIGTLTDKANCWTEGPPVDTSGCTLLQGEVTGCFNVP